ncbi:hypothetical protein BKI52_23350 [marine bacterium AO1-C]|nr:hypothetical protein BKI52_23350 [marine bacterium AO1-C]
MPFSTIIYKVNNPIEIYRQSINTLIPDLNEEEWAYIKQALKVQSIPAKNLLIDTSQSDNELAFVAQGLVRVVYINDQGKEITIRFLKENECVLPCLMLRGQVSSQYSFQCLEPTQIILYSYSHLEKGFDDYPLLERYGRLIAETDLNYLQTRVKTFQVYNAEQRYLRFIDENPGLFKRVSLSHLASYLGIERPSLSRIRKKRSTH